MERIQIALEKARAERAAEQGAAGTVPEAAPGAPPGVPAPGAAAEASAVLPGAPSGPVPVEAAWAALGEVRLDPRRIEKAHVVAAAGGPESAPFDVIRTKLLNQIRAQGWRRIGISSPAPGCGKTTLALNLAFGLARQADLRVILVEADLRRPTMGRLFGLRMAEGGVAEVLEGAIPAAWALRRHRHNLGVLVATGPRRHPAELFQSPRAAEVLSGLEAAYDPLVTLFDLPPMMAGDDVMAFAGHLDGVILVAAAGSTTIAQIDSCERELATRTNVVGVVLNKCRYLSKDQGYGSGY